MIDISKIKVGDKVHYMPFDGCENCIENGIVKEIPEHTKSAVWVVYSCDNSWDNFMDYTSQLTDIDKLYPGWYHGPLLKS